MRKKNVNIPTVSHTGHIQTIENISTNHTPKKPKIVEENKKMHFSANSKAFQLPHLDSECLS